MTGNSKNILCNKGCGPSEVDLSVKTLNALKGTKCKICNKSKDKQIYELLN